MSDIAALIDELEPADWTFAAGQPVNDPETIVDSWDEMLRRFGTSACDDALLEHPNRIRDDLRAKAREAYGQWNEVTATWRPRLAEMVDRKLVRMPDGRKIPKTVRDQVRWALINACLELHYAPYTEVRANVLLCRWLLRGHLPICYLGRYPDGMAVIH